MLQPDWRPAEEWPLDRSIDPTGKDWGALIRGGNNGLYLAIVSLGWWVIGASKCSNERPVDLQDLDMVLADVDWTLSHVLAQARGLTEEAPPSPNYSADSFTHSPPSLKRPADPPTSTLPMKRRRGFSLAVY